MRVRQRHAGWRVLRSHFRFCFFVFCLSQRKKKNKTETNKKKVAKQYFSVKDYAKATKKVQEYHASKSRFPGGPGPLSRTNHLDSEQHWIFATANRWIAANRCFLATKNKPLDIVAWVSFFN